MDKHPSDFSAMKPRRPTAILLLFATSLATWLTLRPRPTAPPSAEATPHHQETAITPASLVPPAAALALAPTVASPVADAPAITPAIPLGTPPTPTVIAPLVTPATTLPQASIEPESSRAEAGSINAIRVRRMITDYHTLTGENPVGTNAEIMAAIMGKNARQAVLGPPDGIELNTQGELVDAWGTPYFFHQLSRDVMEIHSAGPDKIMGTADDIVVR